MITFDLTAGLKKTIQKTISEEDTALNCDGSLKHILATPILSALMIEASANAVDSMLPDGYLTVGRTLNVTHDKPTIEGMVITVEAVLSSIDGDKLLFEIAAYDEIGQIGIATHERYIVNYGILMQKVNERCSILQTKL